MVDVNEEPRSFRPSPGKSNLSLLFFALILAAVLIAVPKAGPWIMRAIMIIAVVLLLAYIRSVRQLRGVLVWRSPFQSLIGVVVGVAVLSVWIWYVVRGFAAGKWIDAAIMSTLVAEIAYLQWFIVRNG